MAPHDAFTAGRASSGTQIGTRRDLFSFAASGLAGAAVLGLVNKSARASDGVLSATHHPAKAKRVIHICLCGGLSHVDSFDYKPRLAELHGKPLPSSEKPDVFFGQVGLLKKNDWAFKQRVKSGLWISDLFPKLAEQADELTLVRSMFAETSNHTPATFQENSGFRLNGFPVLGSWLSYGLGCETENLPAFVVIPDPRGIPAGGSINWTSGFLPAQHQGVILKSAGPPIADLTPATAVSEGQEAATRKLLTAFNARHHEAHPEDLLAARIRSFELAAKMQLAAPEAADLTKESAETRALYGLEGKDSAEFGRACLLARRLLERGVRFVQLYSGGAFGSPRINWDGHEDMVANHSQEAGRIDQPVAGLLADLRRRGMLDDTLVIFTSEFGRTPFSQSKADTVGAGRDHNQYGFTTWLAGAGLKHGVSYGATDDVGYKAVENPVHWNDFHATVLHLLGIDHERLTFYHNGIQRRLTNVHGHVIKEILA
jgi:hypothetical protein